MEKGKITEMDPHNIHHKYDDGEYIRRTKVDNYESYQDTMDKFDKICKGMDEPGLEKKLSEVERAHKHVSNSLEAQKMCRKGKDISDVMKKTAYTKGLLEDQLGIVKDYKKKHLSKNTITPLEDVE